MTLTYRTTGDWGAGKGSNLTAAEFDENFWTQDQRITAIEEDPPTAVGISNILVTGTQMMIYLSDGSTFGPFTLPVAMFRFMGVWGPGIAYSQLDIVTVPQRGMFMVAKNHTSDATFDPDALDEDDDRLYVQVFGEDAYIYDFGFFYPGKPGSGIAPDGYMAAHILGHAISIPVGLSGSKARLRVAPAADLSFPILDQDDTALGSIDFASGETTGTFTFATEWSGAANDYIYLAPPTSVDNDARDLMVTIVASRVTE